MEHLEGILKLADKELASVVENGKFRSRDEIDSVYKLIDIAKDTYEIWCMEEEMEGGDEGMSSRGGSYYREGRGGYNRGSYYEDGGSYERRGRGRNASRDSRGRYNDGGSYRDGMMRRGSYYREGGKEEFAEELRGLMEEAPDQQTRQQIQQMLQQMGQ